jgi:hypothetical protein
MRSPSEYEEMIMAFEMETQINTAEEAKATLKMVRGNQKELRHIKKLINLDMKEIRANYAQEIESAGSGGSAVFSIFGNKRTASSYRASAKRGKRADRDGELDPYTILKVLIDDILLKMEHAKIQIQQFIEEEKLGKEQETIPLPLSCASCGTAISKDDKFCRECGEKVTT